jgi:pimeloyl-ACP methyl ester carboxylesterase
MIRANTYSRLQEDVLLVTWDQRGTARSYSDAIAPETLTVSRLLEASDYENAAKGQRFSGKHLVEECATLDVSALVPAFEVPLTVGVGRDDLVNATEVTVGWFEGVRAPSKRLHVFEQSAHFPNFCEPEAFQSSVAESVAE